MSSPSKWSTASEGQDSFRTAKSGSTQSSATNRSLSVSSRRSAIQDFKSNHNDNNDISEGGINILLMKMLVIYIILSVISSIVIITNTINNLPTFSYDSQSLGQHKNELIGNNYLIENQGTQSKTPEAEETLILDEWDNYLPFSVKLMSDMILWVAVKFAVLIFIALLGLLFTINKFMYGRIIFLVLFVAGNIGLELVFPIKCEWSCTIDVRERRWWQAVTRGIRVLFSLVITVVTLIILCVAGIARIADYYFPSRQPRRTKVVKRSQTVQKVPSVSQAQEPESRFQDVAREDPDEIRPASS